MNLIRKKEKNIMNLIRKKLIKKEEKREENKKSLKLKIFRILLFDFCISINNNFYLINNIYV
jgi:hypothetical protein